jgi:hypothetical protein
MDKIKMGPIYQYDPAEVSAHAHGAGGGALQVSCAGLRTLTPNMEVAPLSVAAARPRPDISGHVMHAPVSDPEVAEDGDNVGSLFLMATLRDVDDAVLACPARDSHQPRPWGRVSDNLSRWSTGGRDREDGRSYNPPRASDSPSAIPGGSLT